MTGLDEFLTTDTAINLFWFLSGAVLWAMLTR